MSTIAITGINSYLAGTILPRLEADPEITRIVGLDVTPWERDYKKVDFYKEDIRSRDLPGLLEGVDTLMHLAFIVQEIHDKKKTHEINIDGSMNVFRACAAKNVRKIVYTSSIAAYGAHPENPIGITEEQPLKENRDNYYSSDKVAVEKFLADFAIEHPEITLTVFRPSIIVGPNLNDFGAGFINRKFAFALRENDTEVQFLHEDDLAEALYLSIKKDLAGHFNVASDDFSTMKEIYRLAGIRAIDIPTRWLKVLANIFFALRLEKVSQGWVSLMQYPIVVSNEKFKKLVGWRPKFSTLGAFQDFLRSKKGG